MTYKNAVKGVVEVFFGILMVGYMRVDTGEVPNCLGFSDA